jgi:beta-galactosidase
MKNFSRRDILKAGVIGPAAVAAVHGMGPLAGAIDGHSARGDRLFEPLLQTANEEAMKKAGRERLLLDFGWRFHLGHATDPAKDFGFTGNFQKTGNFVAAGGAAFDDSEWRQLDLPHDWAIDLPFHNDPALMAKGFYPIGKTYPATSVGWYRRVFEIPAADKGKRITVEFDGAYRESMVVFNNFYIGRHSGGYDPFSFDLHDFANVGGRNVLLVRVDATSSDGWFYEGAGIYRHVWLVKTNSVYVPQWGTFIKSDIKNGMATLSISTEVINHDKAPQRVRLISTVLSPSGEPVGNATSAPQSIGNDEKATFAQKINISNASLWSLEERNLYRLVTELQTERGLTDRYETRFGIRSVAFDANRGFLLNDKLVKLKGTCNHQDHAGIGAALPDAVQYYRVRKLQEMGCNALRTSHNPPAPELLDACDELGMLVFDETRMMSSNPEGMSQFANLVRRDRNRPSVFMWSMGNEEGQANTDKGLAILSGMKALANELDGSRPVSIAPTGAIGTAGGLAVCDVAGYNYMDPQAEEFHKNHPAKPVMGTETVSAVGTRGIYITDSSKGYVASYDPHTTTGRASAEGWWKFCSARPWLSGGFVWTGFDYRGEPSPNGWPNISSQYGIIDTCGFPKDSFYYYKAWWTNEPVLHLFPHWNWAGMEDKRIAVWVYSNLEKIELFHNGHSLGAKDVPKDSHVAWVVKYAPGTIEARGYQGGKVVMTAKRETIGPAAKLVISTDRREISADGEDVAMLAVEVHDAQGRVVPITDNEVTFKVSSTGKLIGVGNGDPTDQTSDKGTSRKAFCGYCMALVQSTKKGGDITVDASAPGLAPATVTIAAKAAMLRPQVAMWGRKVPQGEGITGLWRPISDAASQLWFLESGDSIYSFKQEGNNLTGEVEGTGMSFTGGSDAPAPIVNGKIEGDAISFKAGANTFSGTIKADRIELQRSVNLGWEFPKPAQKPADAPDIGPAPDGTDPSIGNFEIPKTIPVVLRKANR